MNRDWFGDSNDIAKRFFVGELRTMGYSVCVDPMPSGDWEPIESEYLRFLDVAHAREFTPTEPSALLVDPDTGIAERRSRAHASIARIVTDLSRHEIVFVFDQSFSRGLAPAPQLQAKLRQVHEHGAHGFYYNSHARFLFASLSRDKLVAVREAFLKTGLPQYRFIQLETHAA